jgi:RNA recognition motif-containing protein
MKDRDTAKPRGFGFVSFDNEDAVELVMNNLKEHKLLDKWVECKKATPKITSTKPVHAPPHPKPRNVIIHNNSYRSILLISMKWGSSS